MRIEGADRNGNSRFETELLRPLWRQLSFDLIRSCVFALQLRANASEQGIDFDKKIFRRESSQICIPQPFVAHRADAALYFGWIGNAAQRGGDHVAMLECG